MSRMHLCSMRRLRDVWSWVHQQLSPAAYRLIRVPQLWFVRPIVDTNGVPCMCCMPTGLFVEFGAADGSVLFEVWVV